MKKFNKTISLILLITFIINYGTRADVYAQAQTVVVKQVAVTAPADQYKLSDFESVIARVDQIVGRIEQKTVEASEYKELKQLEQSFDQLEETVRAEILKEINSSSKVASIVRGRQEEFIEQFRSQFAEYRKNFRSISDLKSNSRLFKKKSSQLRAVSSSKALTEIKSTTAANISSVDDSLALHIDLTKRSSFASFVSDPLANSGSVIETRVSEKQSTESESGSSEQNTPRAKFQSGPDDLAETEEIQFTAQLDALLDQLATPVEIYEYVLNQIAYEPYYGSEKGSEETILEQAGNDTDQASLLIALLRRSNIAARYVHGLVEIPIEKAKKLLGVKDAALVSSMFTRHGVPVEEVKVAGGEVTAIKLKHVWVRAFISYLPYLGNAGTDGSIAIDLDPSFNFSDVKSAKNITNEIGVEPKTFLAQIKLRGTVDNANHFVTNFPQQSFIIPKLNEWGVSVQNYLNANKLDIYSVIGSTEVEKENYGKIPASLPYDVVSEISEFAELPDTLKYKIRMTLTDVQSGASLIDFQTSLAEIAAKNISLKYGPASDVDRQILANYVSMTELPVYLVQVKPEIAITNLAKPDLVSESSVTMGSSQILSVRFIDANGVEQVVAKPVVAGSIYSLVFNIQKINRNVLNEGLNRLETARQNIVLKDLLSESLNLAGLNYFYEMDQLNRVTAGSLNVKTGREPALLVAGFELKVNELLSLPHTAEFQGVQLDLLRDQYIPVSLDGSKTAESQFLIASSITSSALQASSLEQMFNGAAVSAARLIEVANNSALRIYSADSNSFDQVKNVLSALGVQLVADMADAVHAKKMVTVPEAPVTVGPFQESGYMALDPLTGESSFVLSSGINGSKIGLTSFTPSELVIDGGNQDYLDFSEAPRSWLGMVDEAILNISYDYLPAAASINEWFKNGEQLDPASIVASILAVTGSIKTIGKPHISAVVSKNTVFAPEVGTATCGNFASLSSHCTGLQFSVGNNVHWQVDFLDLSQASPEVVKSFNGNERNVEIVWNGKKTSGDIVRDGNYTYRITANFISNGNASTSEKNGTVTVDSTPPQVHITYPQSLPPLNSVEAGSIFLMGTATDEANFDHYRVKITRGSTTYDDEEFQIPVVNSALLSWNATSIAPNTGFNFLLEAWDKAGNHSSENVTFELKSYKKISILSPASGSSVQENLDSLVRVNDPAIKNLKYYIAGNYLGSVAQSAAGVHSTSWSLWNAPLGNQMFRVDGVAANGSTVVASDQINVTVQGSPAGIRASNLVYTTSFDPTNGEIFHASASLNTATNWRITIHGKPSSDGTQNLIFDSGVHFGSNPQTAWDGKIDSAFVLPQALDGYLWYIYDPAVSPDRSDNRFMLAFFGTGISEPPVVPDEDLKIQLSLPKNGDNVKGIVELKGRIDDQQSSVKTTVFYRASGSETWNASEEKTVRTGHDLEVLGTFDTMAIPNDRYEVYVQAEDSDGHTVNSQVYTYVVSRGAKLGNLSFEETDLKTFIKGIPITFTRKYDSLTSNYPGNLGHGWSLKSVGVRIERTGEHDLIVTDMEGNRNLVIFAPHPADWSFGGRLDPIWNAHYRAEDLSLGIDIKITDDTHVVSESGIWYTTDWKKWNPDLSRISITTRLGLTYRFDDNGNLSQVKNGRNITLDYRDDGIHLNDAVTPIVEWVKDYSGRIERISIPDTNTHIEYIYDAVGDLRKVYHSYNDTEMTGYLTEYDYGNGTNEIGPNHYLIEIRDQVDWNANSTPALPVMAVRAKSHYANGKLESISDASGSNRSHMEYFPDENKAVGTDTLGRKTITYYDKFGNVSKVTDALGHSYSYTYDEYGNRETMTDPKGEVTQYEYGKMYWARDALGGTYSGFTRDELNKQLNPSAVAARLYTYWETWNGIQYPTRIVYPSGVVQGYEYNKRGEIVSASGPLDSFRTEYNDLGEAIANFDLLGRQTKFIRNDDGKITHVQNVENGTVTEYQYHPTGELSKIVRNSEAPPDKQESVALNYNALGFIETQNVSFGTVETTPNKFYYSPQGELKSISEVVNSEKSLLDAKFMPHGPLKQVNTPDGSVNYSYYRPGETTNDIAAGKLKEITYPTSYDVVRKNYQYTETSTTETSHFKDGAYEETVNNILGEQVRYRDRNGHVQENIYDEKGRKTEVRLDGKIFIKQAYDECDRLVAVWDYSRDLARPLETTYEYDGDGREIMMVNSDGLTIKRTYNDRGLLESIKDDRGTTFYEYDTVGRFIRTILPDNSSLSTSYDNQDRVISQIDELNLETKYEYLDNRLWRVFMEPNPLSPGVQALDVIKYLFPTDSSKLIIDASGHTVTYDEAPVIPANSVYKITLNSGASNVVYKKQDEVGSYILGPAVVNWTSKQEAQNFDGKWIRYYFDESNRLVAVYYEKDNRWVLYDSPSGDFGVDQRTTFKVGSSVYSVLYHYQSDGRIESIDWPNGKKVSYTYEKGNVKTVQVIYGDTSLYQATYIYDSFTGRLSSVSDGSISVSYDYNSHGEIERLNYSNGIALQYTRDSRGRVYQLTYRKSGQELWRLLYRFRANSQIEQVQEFTNGSLTRTLFYDYDGLGRLISESIDGATSFSYGYYENGNRKSKKDHSSGVQCNYFYDTNNELSTENCSDGNAYTYSFDDNGNLLERRQGTTVLEKYTYDGENRPVLAELAAAGAEPAKQISYLYDPSGNLLRRNVGGGATTELTADVNRSLSQVLIEAENSSQINYYHGPTTPWMVNSGGARRFIHSDLNHNTRFLSDMNGSKTDTYTYQPFGKVSHSGVYNNSLQFAGEYRDKETGNYFLRERWYQPEQGRFLTRDPSTPIDGERFNLNPYVYAANDPISRIDPSGRFSNITQLTLFVGISLILFGMIAIVSSKSTARMSANFRAQATLVQTDQRFYMPGIAEGLTQGADRCEVASQQMEAVGNFSLSQGTQITLGVVFAGLTAWFFLDDFGKAASFFNTATGRYEARSIILVTESHSEQYISNLRFASEITESQAKDAALRHLAGLQKWEQVVVSRGLENQSFDNLAKTMLKLIDKPDVPGRPTMPKVFKNEVRQLLEAHLNREIELFVPQGTTYNGVMGEIFPGGAAGKMNYQALGRHTSNFSLPDLINKKIAVNPAMLMRAKELPENFWMQNLAEDLVRMVQRGKIPRLQAFDDVTNAVQAIENGTSVKLRLDAEVLARKWAAEFVKSAGREEVQYWQLPEGIEAAERALHQTGYIGPTGPESQRMGWLARETARVKSKRLYGDNPFLKKPPEP